MGLTGTETFTYTVEDAGGLDSAGPGTVTFTTSGLIWFVDSSAGGANLGTFDDPFTALTQLNGGGDVDGVGDMIFVFNGSGANYTGGLVLENNQELRGEAAGLTISNQVNIPAGPKPGINNTAGTGVTLASGNTIRGVNISSNGAHTALAGTNFGVATIDNVGVTATGGTGINLTTGSGTFTFTGVHSSGGTNGVVLNGVNATSFIVAGDGSTGTQGGNGTGGTIRNTSGDGVVLTNSTNITLHNMIIGDATATAANSPDATNNIGGDGVSATGVTGLVLKNVKIARTAAHGVDGTNVTNFTMSDSLVLNAGDVQEENGLNFTGLFGANFVTNSLFDAFNESGIDILNVNGTMDLTVSGTTFQDNQATVGNAGEEAILLDAQGSSQMNVLVSGSTFDDIALQAIDAVPVGTASVHLTVLSSFFVETNAGDAVIKFNPDGNAGTSRSNSITVRGNTFNDDTNGAYAVLLKNDSTGRMDAIIQNNTINDHAGVSLNHDDTGGAGPANGQSFVQIGGSGAGEGNTITNPSGIGIDAIVTENPATGSDPDAHVTIVNNVIGQPPCPLGFCFFNGIRVQSFDNARLNLNISGNTATGSDDFGTGVSNAGINIDRFDSSAFRIQGLGGTSGAAAAAHINATNTSNLAATATGTFGTGSPTLPPATIMPAPLMAAAGVATGASSSADSSPASEEATAGQASSGTHALDVASLSSIIDAAKSRWTATGLSAAQQAALDAVTVSVTDMPGWYLAQATETRLTIDSDAGGWGWYVDATPLDDSDDSFNGRMDLLTTVMHEMGHVLGLEDIYGSTESSNLLYGYLVPGHRRVPVAGQAEQAVPGNISHDAFMITPINIGTLPAGKSVSVIYDVTINAGTTTDISDQGNVTADGGINVATDDPAAGGANDPTVTPVAPPDLIPPTFQAPRSNPVDKLVNVNDVSWFIQFSEGVTGVAVDGSDFDLNFVPGGVVTVTDNGDSDPSTYLLTAFTVPEGTLQIDKISAGTSIVDGGGNAVVEARQGDVRLHTYKVDRTAPTPVISSTEPSTTSAPLIPITVDFGEQVVNFDQTDLSVTNGTVSDFTNVNTQVYTFNIAPTAAGAITVDIAVVAADDRYGNTSNAATQFSITSVAPLTVAITRVNPAQTTATSVDFNVIFSADVVNVDATDFVVVTKGTAGADALVTVGDAGDTDDSTYVVTVTNVSRYGTLELDLHPSTNIQDGAALALTQTPTVDEVYDIINDAHGILSLPARTPGNVLVVISGPNLFLIPDGGDNGVNVSSNAAGDVIVVGVGGTTINGVAEFLAFSGVTGTLPGKLHVSASAGRDLISVADVIVTGDMLLLGGDDVDAIDVINTNVGGNFLAFENGGDGFIDITGGNFTGVAQVFAGNGHNAVTITNTNFGNVLSYTAGSGHDQLTLNTVTIVGGTQLNPGEGNDTINLSNTDHQGTLYVQTAGGHDTINGLNVDVTSTVYINTGAGNDIVDFDDLHAMSVGVLVLGADNDAARFLSSQFDNVANLPISAGNNVIDIQGSTFNGPAYVQASGGALGVRIKNNTFNGSTSLVGGPGGTDKLISDMSSTFASTPNVSGFEDLSLDHLDTAFSALLGLLFP